MAAGGIGRVFSLEGGQPQSVVQGGALGRAGRGRGKSAGGSTASTREGVKIVHRLKEGGG